jgi:mevalonate kinase
MIRRGSACAKFIVAGEHSVAYGSAAIAVALPELRLSVEESAAHSSSTFNGRPLIPTHAEALSALLERFQAGSTHWKIESQIPVGAGLGSSAALCTAILRALHPDWDTSQLFEEARHGEELFHLKASGVDPACVATEKSLFFLPGHLWRELPPLSDKACFGVFHSGQERNTHEVQRRVQQFKSQDPEAFSQCVRVLGENVEGLLKAWLASDLKGCAAVMNESQKRLEELGVCTPKLLDLIHQLRNSGAIGCKVTGAGGGGCVVGLFEGAIPSSALATSCG